MMDSPVRNDLDFNYERRLNTPTRTPIGSPARSSNGSNNGGFKFGYLTPPPDSPSVGSKRTTPHNRSKSDTTALYQEFKRPNSSATSSPTKRRNYNDRFIPSRAGSNFENASPESVWTKSRRSNDESPTGAEDTRNRYDMMLRNELLSSPAKTQPSPVAKLTVHAEDGARSAERTFRFSSPRVLTSRQSFFDSPSVSGSQRMMSSPLHHRKIPKSAFKVLDAPRLKDDFYLNLVDWSSQNVIAVGLDTSVYLWSACTSSVQKLCDVAEETSGDGIASVSWSKRGNYVAIGTCKGSVQVWDPVKCRRVRSMEGHRARVGTMAWNSTVLATGSRDHCVYLRDPRSEQPFICKKEHSQEVCGLQWSHCDNFLASGCNDNRLFVWNTPNPQPLLSFMEHRAAVKAIAWSPHTHGLLASGGGTADRCIRFWNTLTGVPLQAVDTGSQVCNLLWSKNVNEIVSTHGYSLNQIIVWKYSMNLTKLATLTGHTYRVLYLSASPDGQTVVTGAGDETLRFWNVFPGSKGT